MANAVARASKRGGWHGRSSRAAHAGRWQGARREMAGGTAWPVATILLYLSPRDPKPQRSQRGGQQGAAISEAQRARDGGTGADGGAGMRAAATSAPTHAGADERACTQVARSANGGASSWARYGVSKGVSGGGLCADIARGSRRACCAAGCVVCGGAWLGPGNARDAGPRRAAGGGRRTAVAAGRGTTHTASPAARVPCADYRPLVLPSKRRKNRRFLVGWNPTQRRFSFYLKFVATSDRRQTWSGQPANDDSIPARRHIWPTCQRLTSA